MLLSKAMCFSILAAASSQAFSQEVLSSGQLRDWYPGSSVEGQTEKGLSFKAYHGADVKITAILDNKHKNSGLWRIEDPGQVCVAWENSDWGKNPCYLIIKDEDFWRIQRVDDPSRFTRVRRLEGNAFGL